MSQEVRVFKNSSLALKKKKKTSFRSYHYLFNSKMAPQFILKYTSQYILTHMKYSTFFFF